MAGVVAETLSDSNTQRQKGTVSSRASFCAVNKDVKFHDSLNRYASERVELVSFLGGAR